MILVLILSAFAAAIITFVFRRLFPTFKKVEEQIQSFIFNIKNISTLNFKDRYDILWELAPYTPDNVLPEDFLALSNQPEKLISIEKELTTPIE